MPPARATFTAPGTSLACGRSRVSSSAKNNHWSISVPTEKQTASRTIALKARAYGMPGIRVDGNDLLAVYRVVRDAAHRARTGGGPTFIEAVTYRMGAHSTSDDPTRYRSQGESTLGPSRTLSIGCASTSSIWAPSRANPTPPSTRNLRQKLRPRWMTSRRCRPRSAQPSCKTSTRTYLGTCGNSSPSCKGLRLHLRTDNGSKTRRVR